VQNAASLAFDGLLKAAYLPHKLERRRSNLLSSVTGGSKLKSILDIPAHFLSTFIE